MNISEIFIRRPVMTTLVMLGILVFGAMGYRLLPASDLPNVDFPTIQVMASLPGANPETMASSVATPLERQFSTIAGLDSMNSTSSQSSTQITLQFALERPLDAAAQDVQAAIAAAQRQLPPGMPSPPTFQKVNPADTPILYLSLNSPTLPLSAVHEYADTMIAQRISMINGVAQVQIFGPQKYAVRVQLDPNALAARGIGIDEVQRALDQGNVNLPLGTLYGRHQSFLVQATGQLTEAAAYRPLIVAYRNGAPVRLGELGRVLDSVQNDKTAGWYKDARSIVLAVQRQPGTNTVDVVDRIRALLPAFRQQMPASVNLDVLFDRSESIRDSVNDVKFTLVLTVCLVVLVIFLFLRNISATVIPSLALPMSIVGTFAVMYLLNYSLDNLSLMALTLSVGFVVDDAIVVLENIVRHMEMGERPMEAALNGSREIGFTILSMTLSLAAVFIPVLFMGGILGRLFREFAVTIAMAILVSGFVSLSLTPMLASRFLRPPGEKRHGIFYRAMEAVFTGMLRVYELTLRGALRAHPLTFAISLAFDLRHVASVPAGSQGLHPEPGYRPDLRSHRSRAGHLLRLHGGAPAGGRPRHHAEPLRRVVLLQCDARQPGDGVCAPEAAGGTQSHAGGGDREPAPAARGDSRHPRLFAKSAADPRRRPDDPEPVPVHAARRGHEGVVPLGAHHGGQDARAAGLAGREHGSPDQQPPDSGSDRPGQGVCAGGHGRADRECAV
jgi:HAE1 family hydrophobic/amphiphilic exporter-1